MNAKLKMMLAGGSLVVLAGLGTGAVIAAPEAPCGKDGRPPWAAMRDGGFKAIAEKRLGALHDGLKLQAGQEAAWADFQRVLLGEAEKMQTKMKDWRESAADKTAIQRIEHVQQGADARRASLDAVAGATRSFYAVLDDGQKAFFDKNFRLMPHEGRGPGKHRHG